MKKDFKHGQEIWHLSLQQIEKVTFGEYWEEGHVYINCSAGHIQVPVENLFETKAAAESERMSRTCFRIRDDAHREEIINLLKESNPERYALDNDLSFYNMVVDIANLEGISLNDVSEVASNLKVCDEVTFAKQLEKLF